MNTRQLLAIKYLDLFGDDAVFRNSYYFDIKDKWGEYILKKDSDYVENKII
ncbi:hypothetical protein [Streptococcus chenjunshii]|uniref:hypothetical protein n=1 Tax=Streptococcus chenjunshii TaxID=2173853 RepID=UPI0013C34422|nr:hypothetical protein [Streptococcus chenjunshii]